MFFLCWAFCQTQNRVSFIDSNWSSKLQKSFLHNTHNSLNSYTNILYYLLSCQHLSAHCSESISLVVPTNVFVNQVLSSSQNLTTSLVDRAERRSIDLFTFLGFKHINFRDRLLLSVSYTHLDVYKRQQLCRLNCSRC